MKTVMFVVSMLAGGVMLWCGIDSVVQGQYGFSAFFFTMTVWNWFNAFDSTKLPQGRL